MLLLGILAVILIIEWPKIGPVGLTLWYPVTPFILLIGFNHSANYRFIVPLSFLFATFFDTGAYLAGTQFGKHKLAPLISPNKTWEGVLGGVFASLLVLLIPPFHHMLFNHPLATLALVIIVDFAALLGDLFVSLLKRRAGIKDCSNFIPGHGGFLDRLDSVLFIILVLAALHKHL